ncbi:MAG: LysM peptidoglycan-binding domain-containing protein [Armatimonadetes bacterium]|nr:LysM peptidoglycan-binding domain-containing protein [Akkermansiaceae bacterium]
MKIWIFIKIIAGLAVGGVIAFTAALAYHITVKPLGGIFEKIIPEAGTVLRTQPEEDFAKMLDAAEMPDFEPGDRAFQKAHELIAMGQVSEGREKLMAIVNVFPSSPVAPTARRIVGEMNLDEILASNFTTGKSQYQVKRGDSYFAIADRNQTSLDMLMHLNGMMELKNLQPGDDILTMPLNYRLLIEPQRKSLSLWDGAKFVCEYPILSMDGITLRNGKTTIASRLATLDGKNVLSTAKNYRAASKSILIKNPAVRISSPEEDLENPPHGIFLLEADIEELFLLTRTNNEVEIRKTTK